jgi:crossover junction endodeoxyribonuclease RuvC
MIILGIDPGLTTTGFGGIRCGKTTPSLLTCGSIKTSPRDHISRRLFQIHTDINTIIHSLRPDLIAVENAFSLVRYPRAGILLGGVLGIIYLSVFNYTVPMIELTPREVKNALAGYGGAGKLQLKSAVKRLLNITDIQSPHASDALAVALTAYYRKSIGGKR